MARVGRFFFVKSDGWEPSEFEINIPRKFRLLMRSGQIIATSHEFSPQMVVKSKGNPLVSGRSGLVKYYNLTR